MSLFLIQGGPEGRPSLRIRNTHEGAEYPSCVCKPGCGFQGLYIPASKPGNEITFSPLDACPDLFNSGDTDILSGIPNVLSCIAIPVGRGLSYCFF